MVPDRFDSPPAASDVVVVGAGIGGAVLALALGRQGWQVTVIERETQAVSIPRPEILWGATAAALDKLGVGDAIRREASVRIRGIEAVVGDRRLIGMSAAEFDRAEVEPYSTDPGATRALLVSAALATGNVHISRRAEVRRLLRKGDKVCGVCGVQSGHAFESQGRLVVGDDGGHSVVRRGLGIPLETRLFVFDFVAAAVRWPEQLPPDQVRLWLNPRALRTGIAAMAMIPRPGRCGTLLVPLPHDRVAALFAGPADGFWNALAGLTTQAEFLRSQLRFSEDFVRIRRPYGHAPRYVADGAAILGDAAHPVSPAGGQGANAAIWDALSLADVAHDALVAGDLSRKSLARYEALRRPRNSGSVSFTTRAVWGLTILGRVPGLPVVIPSALRIADRLSFLKRSLFRAFATTFVTRERPKQRSR